MASTGQKPIVARQIVRVQDGAATTETIEMVLEEPLSLQINGQQVAVLMRMPGREKELVAGFCLSEGLVGRFDDILMIHHCGQGLPEPGFDGAVPEGTSRNQVQVRVRPEALQSDARMEVVRLIRAGCGAVDVDRAELPLDAVRSEQCFDMAAVLSMPASMRPAQQLHREVGGVHGAGIFDAAGQLVVLCEDVGRHNAVDKAIGHCVLRGMALQDKMLLCSGRLSYEMVTKAIRVGLPLLASVSSPTSLAVEIAEQFNLTVVGYLRGERMSIYSHAERITGAPISSTHEV